MDVVSRLTTLLAMVAFLGMRVVGSPSISHMRREQVVAEHQVQLHASGELIDMRRKSEVRSSSGFRDDYCYIEFFVHDAVTNDCTEPHTEKVTSLKDCKEAADLAGIAPGRPVREIQVDDPFEKIRPKGCFEEPCSEGSDEKCYTFNYVELLPNVTLGNPVCKRRGVVYGWVDPGNKSTTCPGGYELVKDEALCLKLGHCMGDGRAEEDLVNNYDAALYNQYPMYCFVLEENNETYYNKPLNANATPPTDPSMDDIPICKHTVASVNW